MRPSEMLVDSFPHGTVDGFRQGCHGKICPGVMSCAVVFRRYAGDYGFKVRVDRGWTLEQIIAADLIAAVHARGTDRTARPPRKARVRKPRPPRPSIRPDVARLHGEGKRDQEIAVELHVSAAYVAEIRRELGLPVIPRPVKGRAKYQPRPPRVFPDRAAQVTGLHAEGLRDKEIGTRLGLNHRTIRNIRCGLGLPAHPKKDTK